MQPITVAGLSPEDQDLLNDLLRVWQAKLPKNIIRSAYSDGRNTLKDLGIAIPPHLRDVETVVGWPGMAVEKLTETCVFDKVTYGRDADPYGLARLLDDNRFDIDVQQAIGSGLIYSLSFVSTTLGGPGEPDVLIASQSGMWAAGRWNPRLRALSSAVFINETDDLGRPSKVTLFTLRETIVIVKGAAWYVEDVTPNLLPGRIPVEPLPYRPTSDRPLGRSKVNRAVRSATDSGVRTVLRSEISAEFYSTPQRYVLGADDQAFTDDKGQPIPAWQALIGYLLAIGRDKEGAVPTVGQFPQQSQQPHTEQLREIAARFASAANLDLSSMGIVQDNPSSAEAIEKGDRHLAKDASAANKFYAAYLKRVMQNALMVREPVTVMPDEYRSIEVHFMPTSNFTGDDVVKYTTSMPWLAESDVLLEKAGWSASDIQRAMVGKRRADLLSLAAQPSAVETA